MILYRKYNQMKHNQFFGMLCIALLSGAAVGCVSVTQARVVADFSTDKEVYNLYDEVVLTNLSTADGAEIDAYKWEWGDGNVSFEKVPSIPISSDVECTIRIMLTAVASGVNVGDTCSIVIRFVDGNMAPKADFDWSPSIVYRGTPLQFTDASTDADGRIVSWLWNIGGVEFTEQNPLIIAAPDGKVTPPVRSVTGDIEPLTPPVQIADTLTVKLKVTDNGFKTDSLTKKILIYSQDE